MNNSDLAGQVADTAVKAAPPVAVTGLSFYGVALPDIVGLLTIVYLAIQIGYIVWKWRNGK